MCARSATTPYKYAPPCEIAGNVLDQPLLRAGFERACPVGCDELN